MTTNTHSSTDFTVQMARDCIFELKERYPNYSSSQIAKEVGISQPTFNRIENGQVNPTFVTISKLLSATGKHYKITDVIKMAYPNHSENIQLDYSHNEETPLWVVTSPNFSLLVITEILSSWPRQGQEQLVMKLKMSTVLTA